MANQHSRRVRRTTPAPREPEVTRYTHPIYTQPPCAGYMSWIRGTLACHSQMLEEILTLLREQEELRHLRQAAEEGDASGQHGLV